MTNACTRAAQANFLSLIEYRVRRRVMRGVGRLLVMNQRMIMCYKTRFFVVCFLCIFYMHDSAIAQSRDFERQLIGKVQFNAILPNDILNPFLTVIVEGENVKKEFHLDADIDSKANLIELPIGIYRASSRKGIYYSFRRAQFRVSTGTVVSINIFRLLRLRTQTLRSDGTDRYEFAPEPQYASLPLPDGSNTALTMLIRHDEKKKGKGFVEYTGNIRELRGSPEAVPRGVMDTYDALTIYAEKVIFNKRGSILEAEGDVVVEDGKQRIRAKKVDVKFKRRIPELHIE